MTKYIDAEHLKWNTGGINCGSLTVNYLHFIIDTQEPTINIVRCKDCQYYDERYQWCNRYLNMHLQTYEDGYCAWAEEKKVP